MTSISTMENMLSNELIFFSVAWQIIPLFIDVRSYIKRRNGVLAIATALFAFSICHIVGETILPIPLYYEPDPMFRIEESIISFDFNRYWPETLKTSILFGCYFLIFTFFLRGIFITMQKFWKVGLSLILMLGISIGYILGRNLIYEDIVAYLNLISMIMGFLGGVAGYFFSYLLGKINPPFYHRMTLKASPKVERANLMMDLD